MPSHILIVDDQPAVVMFLAAVFLEQEYKITTAESGTQALALIKDSVFDLIVLDVQLADMSGIELCTQIKKMQDKKHIPVILITAFGSIEIAVKAMDLGAFYFLTKPVKADEILLLTKRALENSQLQRELAHLKRKTSQGECYGNILGKSYKMQQLFEMIAQVAGRDTTVLIQGNSGTGKELVAKAIHQNSQRAAELFVTVDCGAISENLLESEFFGHVKGAFTGAIADRKGIFVRANRGTLFLDEVGNLSPSLQSKLLRALQEKQITPVGSDTTVEIDVRIIAATNMSLPKMVADGKFRKDLLFRLNVLTITLPDLKERPEDIPLLAQHFLEKYQSNGKTITGFSKAALKTLLSYDWPGNIRELEHAIEHATIMAKNSQIMPKDFPPFVKESPETALPSLSDERPLVSLEQMEREYIAYVLKQTKCNQTQAAAILAIDRSSLWRKIKKHRLEQGEI